MLTALDALIQNGTGGRQTLVLRQLCSLFMKVGSIGEESTTGLFDEIMANLAVDLDDEVVLFLAPEVGQISGLLPAFKSTVASRSFEIQARNQPSVETEAALETIASKNADISPNLGTGSFSELARYAQGAEKDFVPNLRQMTLSAIGPDKSDTVVRQDAEFHASLEMQNDVFDLVLTHNDNGTAAPVAHGTEKPPSHISEEELGSLAPVVVLEDMSDRPAIPSFKPQIEIPQHPERRAEQRDPVTDASNPVTLARRASPAELMQIASVPHLPENLTNVIVMRGERDAIVKALQNSSAKFSRSSLTTLAELAPSDLMIKQALVQRIDLPELIIERMLPFLNLESKARLLISGSVFGEKEARAALEQANGDLVNAYRNGNMLIGLDTCLTSVQDGTMTVSEAVVALAQELRVAELAMFAARLLGLNLSTPFNMLAGRIDKSAGILAGALQCDRQAITAVMDMRRRCGAMSDARGALETHMRISPQEALALVRQADQLASELEPVVPSEADRNLLGRAA